MGDRKSSNQRPFEQQALPHTRALYGFALRLRGNAADADDLVQETFLKAYRFWDKYDQGTNIRAWLYRIMKNSFINLYRKESKAPHMVDYCETMAPGVRHLSSPEWKGPKEVDFDSLIDDEMSGAVSNLPADFRTVVLLRDIEGLTYEEIAGFVDCPLGTVRSRIHRGRRLLRAELEGYAKARGYALGIRSGDSEHTSYGYSSTCAKLASSGL